MKVNSSVSRASFAFGLLVAMVTIAGCSGAASDGSSTDDTNGSAASGTGGESRSRVVSQAEYARMERFANERVAASEVVHSFKLPNGDAVDCVARENQPSLRAPEMRGHVIATPPNASPSPAAAQKDLHEGAAFLHAESIDANGVKLSCPAGTVPIKKIAASDLARFSTLEDRMRKYPSHLGGNEARDPEHPYLFTGAKSATIQPPANGPVGGHQYAHGYQFVSNAGAHVRINTLVPNVQSNSEFSLGQTWVVNGSGSGLQTLEVGVQKYVDLYGDSNLHLFIYSTSDGYQSTGCYNLECSRFVQTDNSVVIGGGLTASVPGGAQYDVELEWLLYNGNWWLEVNSTWVGYYPGSLYNAAGLLNGSKEIDFGGEIIDDRTAHSAHTTTDMGSGAFPSAGFSNAAYQRDIYYFTNSSTTTYATLNGVRDDASCYDIAVTSNGGTGWNTYFFYGGPGYNANCQ